MFGHLDPHLQLPAPSFVGSSNCYIKGLEQEPTNMIAMLMKGRTGSCFDVVAGGPD